MASERDPGFYWVRPRKRGAWQLWHHDRSGYWKVVPYIEGGWSERLENFAEIGPRIIPPDPEREVAGE